MATTRIMPLHIGKGRTESQAMTTFIPVLLITATFYCCFPF